MYNWKGWRRSSSTGKQHRREAEGGLLCSWKKVEGRSINERHLPCKEAHNSFPKGGNMSLEFFSSVTRSHNVLEK